MTKSVSCQDYAPEGYRLLVQVPDNKLNKQEVLDWAAKTFNRDRSSLKVVDGYVESHLNTSSPKKPPEYIPNVGYMIFVPRRKGEPLYGNQWLYKQQEIQHVSGTVQSGTEPGYTATETVYQQQG